MIIALTFIGLFLLLIIGVPVAFSLGLSTMGIFFIQDISLEISVQRIVSTMDSFSLMAIPFFILAGTLMLQGGISQRLIDFANSLVGRFTGGLAIVSVITAMFFSAMSGSGAATVAAIGGILIPAMVRHGYPNKFATSLQAVSGELGIIIPPSIAMIIFALSAGVPLSIGDMFLAGIVPGLMIGTSLIILVYFLSKYRKYGTNTLKEEQTKIADMTVFTAFKRAILPLFMPVIILGGIYSGIFTATEAAAVAVGYALFVGIVLRTLTLKKVVSSLKEAAISSSTIMIIIGCAGLFGWLLTAERIPNKVADAFISFSDSPIVFLLIVNLLLLLVGMFLETGAAIVIIAPILTPVAMSLGVDPAHFGVIMICNLAMGLITPPVGVNLFVACQIGKLRIEQLIKPLMPFYAVIAVNILLITYFPQLSIGILKLFN